MLSKDDAFQLTRAKEQKDVEDVINQKIDNMEYSAEMLNLTKYQQEIIQAAGYSLTHTANKNGYVWLIKWE